jgi:hypothetical protein
VRQSELEAVESSRIEQQERAIALNRYINNLNMKNKQLPVPAFYPDLRTRTQLSLPGQ